MDNTILTALSAIAAQQSAPTNQTLAEVTQFLDYMASHEEAIITYHASDMVLAVHSDASYLNAPNARSRVGGYHFLSNDTADPPTNGPVLTVAQILKHVVTSAAEAEIGGLFVNAKAAVPERHTLVEMGHNQPATPMQTDNTTASDILTKKVQPKRTKSMDMRFHWLRDRGCQQNFRFYWRPGHSNKGDYYTKHHSGAHHKATRPALFTAPAVLRALRARLTNQT